MRDPVQAVERIVRLLRRNPALRAVERAAEGAEVHLVGGLLRDRMLGLASRDVDVVVAGRGREIAAATASELGATLVLLGADRHAAFRIVGGALAADGTGSAGEDTGWVLDLWDRRETTLEQDLARRDFTVNSFAARLADGRLTDPFGGVADLGRRLLRATTPESFRADPLRILRLPRLLGQLPGFAAGAGTVGLARSAAPGLVAVAAERVRAELALIFRGEDAPRSLALLAVMGVYPGLWLGSLGEGPAAARDDDFGATGVRYLSALPAAVHRLRELDRRATETLHPLAARIALTFAGLPAGESRPRADRVIAFAAAGYLTRQVADRVSRLLGLDELPADESARRHFLHDLGKLWPTAAATLGARAGEAGRDDWERRLRPLVELARREGADLIDPPRLLGGEEVQELLGVPPGPAVGEALATVRRAQVEGTVRSKAEAVALLRGG